MKLYEFGKTYQFTNAEAEKVTKRYTEEKHLAIVASGQVNLENWNKEKKEVPYYQQKEHEERQKG